MRNKNKEIVFSNGDQMKPVFCLDGKKYYTDKDVERLIEEYDDRLRVARGNLNLVETLNSFVERDLKIARRALWIAREKRAIEKIAWFKLWNASISTMNPEDGARQEFDKWKRNLGKFLKKAEEYK